MADAVLADLYKPEYVSAELVEKIAYAPRVACWKEQMCIRDRYFETSSVRNSVISDGCLIEGSIENSIIGRGCIIKKNAVIKNSVILPGCTIGEGALIENQVIDKRAQIVHAKELIADKDHPGYIRRGDRI